jgi:predicted NBD/HSP70 family sugar kinase
VVIDRLHRALVDGEALPRVALASDTRLSGTVLTRVLDELKDHGLVAEGTRAGLRGPNRSHFLKPDGGFVLAIGFGHDRLGVALTDLSGELLSEADYVSDPLPSQIEDDPTGSLAVAAEQANGFIAKFMAGRGADLVGVGVSLPAPLMEDGRLYAGFMDAWQSRNLPDELRRALKLPDSVPVVLGHDANLVAIREHTRGAARDASHACVVKWGSGLTAGLIVDNRLYKGPRGLAGEFAHITTIAGSGDPDPADTLSLLTELDPEERECRRCGEACLEALIRSDGLLAVLARRDSSFPTIGAAIGAAEAGDDTAKGVFAQAGHLLGHKLGPIISTLNLQHLVLDCFTDPRAFLLVADGLADGLRHRMVGAAYQQLTVQPARWGPTAAILGAADLVLQNHLGHWATRIVQGSASRS